MPYIKKEERIMDMLLDTPSSPGQLAYCIQKLVSDYMELSGRNYTTYAMVTGILETLKLELYRRVIGPYEEFKKDENGDVEW